MGMIDRTKQYVFSVDDEPQIWKVVDRTLTRLGVEVHCFASAFECLEQLGSQKCDLLITDVHFIMEDKSNKEVARDLHRSVKTIEGPRYRMMRKLGIDNIMDLLRRTAVMGLVDLPR